MVITDGVYCASSGCTDGCCSGTSPFQNATIGCCCTSCPDFLDYHNQFITAEIDIYGIKIGNFTDLQLNGITSGDYNDDTRVFTSGFNLTEVFMNITEGLSPVCIFIANFDECNKQASNIACTNIAHGGLNTSAEMESYSDGQNCDTTACHAEGSTVTISCQDHYKLMIDIDGDMESYFMDSDIGDLYGELNAVCIDGSWYIIVSSDCKQVHDTNGYFCELTSEACLDMDPPNTEGDSSSCSTMSHGGYENGNEAETYSAGSCACAENSTVSLICTGPGNIIVKLPSPYNQYVNFGPNDVLGTCIDGDWYVSFKQTCIAIDDNEYFCENPVPCEDDVIDTSNCTDIVVDGSSNGAEILDYSDLLSQGDCGGTACHTEGTYLVMYCSNSSDTLEIDRSGGFFFTVVPATNDVAIAQCIDGSWVTMDRIAVGNNVCDIIDDIHC